MKTSIRLFADYINALFKNERQALLLLLLLAIMIRILFVIIHYNIRGTVESRQVCQQSIHDGCTMDTYDSGNVL